MAVSLNEVARAAGVSLATASKAVNGRSDVSEATRKRVLHLAETMGYTPNFLARGLGGGRTGTVGVITSDLEGRFVLPIVMGIEDALGADRIQVLLCDARGDDARERRHVQALIERQVDGLVIVGRQTDFRASLGPLPIPVVYAYAMSSDAEDISVSPDNVHAGILAVEHLLSSGRRRLAHISGEAPHLAAIRRREGIERALGDAGLDLVGDPLFGDWSEGWGRAAAATVLDGEPIDAIICGSDQIARGALDTLRDRGISVPGEIAVMSVDNWVTLAANSRPALSTIDLNLERLGRRAARRLFDAVDGDAGASGVEYLPCSVVIRDSTIRRG